VLSWSRTGTRQQGGRAQVAGCEWAVGVRHRTGQEPPGATRGVRGKCGALMTLLAQMISSGSNFLLGILIARAGGASALGQFGVAFLIWLAVLGANRALVTEPMTVTGSVDDRRAQLPEGLIASLVLGGWATIALLGVCLGVHLIGVDVTALLALAACIPSLLAHDFCRSTAFRLQCPGRALAGDAGFAVVQAALSIGLFEAGVRESAAFVLAWGIGATAGAIVGIVLNGIRPILRGGVRHIRRLWAHSRWFLGEFCTAFPADQGYLLLLPLLLGSVQFGLYRSGAGLLGPVVVILVAGGNIGLPESVRRLRENGMPGLSRYALRLTALVLGVVILYCGFVAIFAEWLLRMTYGPQFTEAVTITRLIAVQYVLLALSFGFGQAVKACGLMRQLWATRAVSALASITTVVVLSEDLGLVGAGIASLIAGGAYSTGVMVAYWRTSRVHAVDGAQLPGLGTVEVTSKVPANSDT
jgi:O-antigen/teichoic acid export membrane protein